MKHIQKFHIYIYISLSLTVKCKIKVILYSSSVNRNGNRCTCIAGDDSYKHSCLFSDPVELTFHIVSLLL